MMTIKEVAELAGVSTRTVRRWIERGELETVDVSGSVSSPYRQHRIPEDVLATFVAGRQQIVPDRPKAKREPRPDDWVDYY